MTYSIIAESFFYQVINYYGQEIYLLLGIETGTALKIVGISGALSIIYCMIGLYILDRVGRVKPLLVATTGCALALLVNAILSQYYVAGKDLAAGSNENALRAMVAMNFVFSFFFTMIGIITWVYVSSVLWCWNYTPADTLSQQVSSRDLQH